MFYSKHTHYSVLELHSAHMYSIPRTHCRCRQDSPVALQIAFAPLKRPFLHFLQGIECLLWNSNFPTSFWWERVQGTRRQCKKIFFDWLKVLHTLSFLKHFSTSG